MIIITIDLKIGEIKITNQLIKLECMEKIHVIHCFTIKVYIACPFSDIEHLIIEHLIRNHTHPIDDRDANVRPPKDGTDDLIAVWFVFGIMMAIATVVWMIEIAAGRSTIRK